MGDEKKRDILNAKLDKEERELLKSVERGEWKTVKHAKKEAAFAKAAAANSLRKDEMVDPLS